MWMVLALALGGAQLGCDGGTTEPNPNGDSDGDGVVDSEDCDDTSNQRWKQVRVYKDVDNDGHGFGSVVTLCTGDTLPGGYAAAADDCAPQDATRWRLPDDFIYADRDGDGVASATPLKLCVGAGLPSGYKAALAEGEDDCDDADAKVWTRRALYGDWDGDGFPGGVSTQRCVGATLPAGTSETATDCAPEDPTRYTMVRYAYRDADGDGRTVAESGEVCGGLTLPKGYAQTPGLPDCDDTRATVWQELVVYADSDGDGVGSGAQQETRCSGSIPEPGYSQLTGDCAPDDSTRWMTRSYSYRDADGDGARVAESGQLCTDNVLPAGYFTSAGSSALDCDDTNPLARVTWNVFADADNDGVGAGPAVVLCAGTSRPSGYADTGTDCAPDEPSLWRGATYQYRDADGDSFTVASGGSLCAGASLPAGYTNSPNGNDCDDSRADLYQGYQAYVDEDGDGVGAGSAAPLCTSGPLPGGYSPQGTDCAPTDAASWQRLSYKYVDADGDGRTVPSTGDVCTGAKLPASYANTATGNDCDDSNPALYLWRVLYPDRDGDGVGAPPRVVMCLDDGPVPPGHSIYGFDPDDSNPATAWPTEEPELEVLLLDD
jgi:hypothetical protein